MDDPEKIIEELFEQGILVNKELLSKEIDNTFLQKIKTEADLIVLNSDYLDVIRQEERLIDWYDIDKYRVEAEKERNEELYQRQLQQFKNTSLTVEMPSQNQQRNITSLEVAVEETSSHFSANANVVETESPELLSSLPDQGIISQTSSSVTVVLSFQNIPHKYSVDDFANFFTSRYRFLENLLRNRHELQNILTITRILGKKEKENVAAIGVVEDIGESKAGNMIVTIEDPTGKIKIIISKSKKDLYTAAKDLVVDEVIGISGTSHDKVIFAENIIWPDIPDNDLKKGEEEEHIIFLSDIHVGSKLFLKDEFNRFLRWINGKTGNETQRRLAQKVKYIFIGGDLVDGVGVYPSQEEELEIKDIAEQYAEFSRLLRQIPSDKKIVICPGNHDVVYLAEPQPVFYQEFAPGLFNLPNVTLVTNPAVINIGKTATFPGFDILLYHGYSFDYYVANVESIRTGGGYHRSDLIMKFLLKRRHLAPSFTSTPYYPSHKEDPLLIRKVPDFFLTGHIHYSCVANYKGVTMISGSCWQGKTTFQEKLGHEPEPARVPIINLKTREVKVLRFG